MKFRVMVKRFDGAFDIFHNVNADSAKEAVSQIISKIKDAGLAFYYRSDTAPIAIEEIEEDSISGLCEDYGKEHEERRD